MAHRLFPMFLKLEDRACLVVGAGTVAESKIRSLLETSARVTVVAPEANAAIAELAGAKALRWWRRKFRPSDLRGIFLCIAATSDPEVNGTVFEKARRLGVLCNAVDDPPHCDFYFPAVVRRGDLQVAVSTAGQSPALAQRLRMELEEALDSSWEARVRLIGEARRRILGRHRPSAERKRMLKRLAFG